VSAAIRHTTHTLEPTRAVRRLQREAHTPVCPSRHSTAAATRRCVLPRLASHTDRDCTSAAAAAAATGEVAPTTRFLLPESAGE